MGARALVLCGLAAISIAGGTARADEPPAPATRGPATRGPATRGPAAAATEAAARGAPAGDLDGSFEGVEVEAPDDERGPIAEVSGGVEVWSAYFDRGFLVEAAAFVVQPWIAVDVPLLRCAGAVDDVRFVADGFASLEDGETGLGGGPHAPKGWYEADVWLGLASHVRERLDVRLDYQLSWSPNGSFERFEELALQLDYDDEATFASRGGRFRGFAPTMLLACETRGQNDDGRHLGRYLELRAEPRWACCGEGEPALDLSVPVRLGLSVGDYYEDADGRDETFGFVAVGVRLAVGLGRLSRPLDDWTATATVGGIWLGDHAAEAGDGRRSRLVTAFGLAWEP